MDEENAANLAAMWDGLIGPFLSVTTIMSQLGVDTVGLRDLVAQRRLLCVTTADGTQLFPSFQFVNGVVPTRLAKVLMALDPDGADPWGDALFLQAPTGALNGLSPCAALMTEQAEFALALALRAGHSRRL